MAGVDHGAVRGGTPSSARRSAPSAAGCGRSRRSPSRRRAGRRSRAAARRSTTIAVTIRLDSTRRSSAVQRSVPGSRARSVASSRSHSSISCRIASRTDSGPAARSRAMNRKCERWPAHVPQQRVDRLVDDAAERGGRAGAAYVAEHGAQGHERLVDQRQAERLDRVEVPVERGRHDADLLGHLAQRDGGQAAVLAEREGGVEDRAAGALLALDAALGAACRPPSPSYRCTCVHAHDRSA